MALYCREVDQFGKVLVFCWCASNIDNTLVKEIIDKETKKLKQEIEELKTRPDKFI